MARNKFANNVRTTFTSITAGATTLAVSSDTGFPTVPAHPSTGDFFYLSLFYLVGTVETDMEIVKVISKVAPNVYTIVRGQGGTSDIEHSNLNTNYASLRLTAEGADLFAQAEDLAAYQATSEKDASGGYAGLTLFKINFKNALNTFTSFFTNSNTAARTYTFQDRNGTIADDTDLALKENAANKATDFSTVNNTLFPTVQAVKTYADALVVGLLDDRGSFDASSTNWPSSGGSGSAGAILKGDLWYISVAGTLGGTAVSVGDTIRALVDSPGTTASNWDIIIAPVSVAGQIHAATSKATPVDADELGLVDSAASNVLKKLTWANLKTTMYAALGALIAAGTSKATPVDADGIAIQDSAASNATKTLTWANLKATLVATANSWTGQQTFKETKDADYTITDGAAFEIDPANGNIQKVTLGASRTPAATNFEAGQHVLLGIDDGTAYSITWTTVAVTWVKVGGTASAPSLATSGWTWVFLWKSGSTIYGIEVGKP